MVFPGSPAHTPPREGDPLAAHASARVALLAVSVVTSEQRAALLRLAPALKTQAPTQMRPNDLERRLQTPQTPLVPLPAPNCSTS
jgi:hypothetical protein